MATKLGLEPEFIKGDWRSGVPCRRDRGAPSGGQEPRHQGGVRGAQRDLDGRHVRHCCGSPGDRPSRMHSALLLVDTISSLGSIDYRHEEWGVDVTVGGSQKGLGGG